MNRYYHKKKEYREFGEIGLFVFEESAQDKRIDVGLIALCEVQSRSEALFSLAEPDDWRSGEIAGPPGSFQSH